MNKNLKKVITVLVVIFMIWTIKYVLEVRNYILIQLVILIDLLIIIVYFKFLKNNARQNDRNIYKEIELPEEFKKMYLELNKKYVIALEKVRKKYLYKLGVTYVFLFTGAFILSRTFKLIKGNNIAISFLILSGMFIIIVLKLFAERVKYKKSYINFYKQKVVKDFIEIINKDLDYSPKCSNFSSIPGKYAIANFDNKKFDEFHGEDMVVGKIGNDSFLEMAEVEVIKLERNNEIEKSKNRLFKGIFASITTKNCINSEIKITKNKMIKVFNRQENNVEMDSQVFENYFDVYSNDEILTMRIITPELMQEIIEFYEKYKIEFDIVIRNNYIFIRFYSGIMFEPTVFKNSINKDYLFTYYCIFKFILEITERVNKAVNDVII